jgi:hypothetical protein
VALVGFDEFALADKLTPPVTVVAEDPAAIGATAAQLLFTRINGDTSPPHDVLLLTRLIALGSGEITPVDKSDFSRNFLNGLVLVLYAADGIQEGD